MSRSGRFGRLNHFAHYAPLPLRIVWGMIFIAHGLPKLLQTGGAAQFFGTIGLPVPAVTAVIIGLIEVVGGAMVFVGAFTRLAAALLGLVMLGAIVAAKFPLGFVGGWEFDLALLAGAVSLVLSGPSGHRPGF